MKHRTLIVALLALILTTLSTAGCSSSPVVAGSGPRPPTKPEQVRIYQDAPSKYELLDTIEIPAQGQVTWDDRGNADEGFEQLKAKAAALGATGLYLKRGIPGTYLVLAGYKETNYQVTIRPGNPKIVVAQAIYVVKE